MREVLSRFRAFLKNALECPGCWTAIFGTTSIRTQATAKPKCGHSGKRTGRRLFEQHGPPGRISRNGRAKNSCYFMPKGDIIHSQFE